MSTTRPDLPPVPHPPPPSFHVSGATNSVTLWATPPDGSTYNQQTFTGKDGWWSDLWVNDECLPFNVRANSLPRLSPGLGSPYSAIETTVAITGGLWGVQGRDGEALPINVLVSGGSQLVYTFTPSNFGTPPPGQVMAYDLTVEATGRVTLKDGQSFSASTSVRASDYI
ncbi:MAG TPA: hypothetical protein VKG43_06505 [Acidimicrobiales bacterium]|nr:hypothetical protein [Acidimicrobiales bacterium]